jgi:hypothetical protein
VAASFVSHVTALAAIARDLELGHAVVLQTYKATCRQCGDIVQHRLGNDEALRCRNDHFVPPPIARDAIIKPPLPGPGPLATGGPATAITPKITRWRNMSQKAQRRRAIKAHNHQMRARTIKHQRDG